MAREISRRRDEDLVLPATHPAMTSRLAGDPILATYVNHGDVCADGAGNQNLWHIVLAGEDR